MKMKLGTVVVFAVLFAILGMATYYAYRGLAVPGVSVPEAGWVGLFFGGLLSILLGAGLMTLLSYSSRQGYDEPPHFRNDSGDNSSA